MKERKHRIIIKNLEVTNELVAQMTKDDLGQIELISWSVEDAFHFHSRVANGGDTLYSQSIIIVLVTYRD